MKLIAIINKKGVSMGEFLLVNYFWLITFAAVCSLATGIGWLAGLLFPIIIYWCLFFSKSYKIDDSILDNLWWLIFIWDIFSLLINNYPSSGIMAIRCLTSQLAYMMVYWIVRKKPNINVSAIISSAYLPFLITSVLGIIFFVHPPSWYVRTDVVTSFEEMQASRLRSIFASGYNISYFGAILVMYEFFNLVKGIAYKKTHYFIITLTLVTVLLTAQRAPMASLLIGFCVSLVYALMYGGFRNIRTMSILLGTSVLAIIFVISSLDSSTVSFLFDKFESVTNSDSGYIQERLILNKGESTFTLWGDGVGRHNFYADLYPPNFSMRDGEYVKLLMEQGYIGAFLYILFWGMALLKSLFNFRNLSFELCLLVMLGICMIGANPLSTVDKYPFIFWMAAGQIANFSNRRNGKNRIVNSYCDIQRGAVITKGS